MIENKLKNNQQVVRSQVPGINREITLEMENYHLS
jgi:hypothetical protein